MRIVNTATKKRIMTKMTENKETSGEKHLLVNEISLHLFICIASVIPLAL